MAARGGEAARTPPPPRRPAGVRTRGAPTSPSGRRPVRRATSGPTGRGRSACTAARRAAGRLLRHRLGLRLGHGPRGVGRPRRLRGHRRLHRLGGVDGLTRLDRLTRLAGLRGLHRLQGLQGPRQAVQLRPEDLRGPRVRAALPHAVRAVVADGVVHRFVLVDPFEHPAHVLRIVAVSEQAPLRIGDRLSVGRGEFHVMPQPVRFVRLLVESPARRLVVGIHPHDVHDVVTRIALRPRNGVPSAIGGEVEPELLAGHLAHGGDDAFPVPLPRVRIRPAAVAVRRAVHLPAEDDDGVGRPHPHQPLGERAEVVVEQAVGATPQQRPHQTVRQPALVALQHRHVEHQQPVLTLPPPLRPRFQEARLARDVGPPVAGQVGVADPQLGAAEPLLQLRHAPDAARAVVEVGAQRRLPGGHRVPGRGEVRRVAGSRHHGAGDQQAGGEHPQPGTRRPSAVPHHRLLPRAAVRPVGGPARRRTRRRGAGPSARRPRPPFPSGGRAAPEFLRSRRRVRQPGPPVPPCPRNPSSPSDPRGGPAFSGQCAHRVDQKYSY